MNDHGRIDGVAPQPLTEAQEGLWYAQALDPASPILNTGQYLDLTGPIDLDALRLALTRTLAETEALRLRFASGPDGPVQWLHPEAVLPQVVDLSARPDAEAHALAEMLADSDRPVALATKPAARFTLFILGADRCLIYERIHHLAIDGYGMVLVTNRIAEHYSSLVNGTPSPLPFPPLSRATEDDAAWRASDRRNADRDWWHARLADLPPAMGPAGGRAVSAHGFLRESRWLPPALARDLAALADRARLGWPDVLAALTGAYLARWTGGRAVIGLPFMARMGRRIARLPCMAMNVLPQLISPDEDAPLADWLAATCADMAQARRHGLYRSEYLRRELGLIGGDRRLYGPLVNVQPFDRPPVFAGLRTVLHILGAGAVDDLTLTFRGDPVSGILFEADANPDLYSPQDVAGHAERLPAFLASALAASRLSEVSTASQAEIAAVAALHDAARHPVPDTTLTDLIAAQVAATPDSPAVTFGERTLSFAQLDARSAALAGRLAQMGAGPGRIVAVALERGLDLPVALLAVMRTGAAYLPLDPDHPPARIARILQRAKPAVVLTSAELSGLFAPGTPLLTPPDWPQHGPMGGKAPTPDDTAYVIFTSGSTGEAKGVVVSHRAIVNRLCWMAAEYGIGPADRILQKTPATFDVSVWELFLPMMTGAHLVMAQPGAHRDPARIAAAIRRHDITVLHFVPSMLSAFLAAPASAGLALRCVFCSGEELTADQRDRFHARIDGALHNLYGPTEAAVDVSYWPAAGDTAGPVPIGWPVWNTRLEILDDRMRPVPPGLAGHLHLGGVQLAQGYLGQPELTAERFIPDPAHPGQQLYATGDLARRRHDGAVVFLGRSDHQVKIRGLRIELGEIEAAITASDLAREAVVLARKGPAGDMHLVAYLVPQPHWRPGDLARHLSTQLPAYMVPQAEIALDAMPVTSNGKLDRSALPAPVFSAEGRAPITPTEHLLARLYAEVLALAEPLPAEADFFALGGDSLSAVRLLLAIGEQTGRDPGLGAVFAHPVLSQLAAVLDAGAVHDDGLGPTILLADGEPDTAPLFLIHPAGGLAWGYRHLARLIAPARRVWGVQHPGLDPSQPMPSGIRALAQDYAAHIAALVPSGPVHLAGWSVGGIIAQEVALALEAQGRVPGMVAALDSYPADAWRDQPDPDAVAALRALLAIAGHDPEAHQDLDTRDKVMGFLRRGDSALGALPEDVLDGVVRVVTDTNRLVRGHSHRRMAGRLTHIRAALDHAGTNLSAAMWTPYAEVEMEEVPFLHADMTSPAASALIAPMLARRMRD
ncbi:MAG: amino acid adenylation domain-containing protein [Paracoccus sp. (in: a-proteobacteria)]|uniref:amino acid adenylation domain-containing protein n=1 Tax=Paracoccus sp. TaxID=267 RepID=UPI0026DF4A88|nr:amino acid adenylation domain-containing protein [Paracoccus sp. (in: a-proteobacteria)]MDO5622758.1 amino acid adenylation domain-containing protein [Paracoccus sp. (in: a-proteobacteria)]